MIVNYTYKYRIYPTERQKVLINKHIGCSRFVYNRFLSVQKENYKNGNKFISHFKLCNELPKLKADYEWLKEVNAQSLQGSLKNLDQAYKNFFSKTHNGSHPKFKKKTNGGSFIVPQNTRVENHKLYIGRFKDGIKIKLHTPLNGTIRRATITLEPCGQYYASILVHKDIGELPKTNKSIGIDLGLKDMVITSEAEVIKNNRYYKKYEDKLKKEQRRLKRKIKGSNSYKSQVRKIAKIHFKIRCLRKDYLHKVTTNLIRENDIICLETLKIKEMIQNKQYSKQIQDVSWSTLVLMLEYKASWYGKTISKIDTYYPSSKTCSVCGYVKNDLTIKDRTWKCPDCGVEHDRDVNASINIHREGLKLLQIA